MCPAYACEICGVWPTADCLENLLHCFLGNPSPTIHALHNGKDSPHHRRNGPPRSTSRQGLQSRRLGCQRHRLHTRKPTWNREARPRQRGRSCCYPREDQVSRVSSWHGSSMYFVVPYCTISLLITAAADHTSSCIVSLDLYLCICHPRYSFWATFC